MSSTDLIMGSAGVGGGSPVDPYFNNVVLQLNGDGTNGAQNNTFLDSSTNNFTITRNGNTTQGSFSPYGNLWSNYLSGASGNYLSVANNTNLIVGSGDFTIECWVNMSAVNSGNANPIISKCGSGSTSGWLLSSSSGGLWQFSDYYGNNLIRAGTVVVGALTHLAVTRSGSTVTLWVNGTSVGTASYSTNFSDTTALMIGYSADYVYTNAYVSNVRLVKNTALYSSTFTPSTTPLTAVTNTKLLTCQSNRFIDNSSNAFAITVNGTPSVQRFSPFNPTAPYDTATIGGSGYFDGSSYLTVPDDSAWSQAGDYTIECWYNPIGFTSTRTLIGYSSAANTVWLLQVNTSGQAYFLWRNTATTAFTVTSPSAIPLNAWTHLAVTFSGTTITLWVNGVSVATTTLSGTVRTTTGALLGVGSWGAFTGDPHPYGYMSNVRIVKGTAVYSGASFSLPTAPLTAITNTSLLTNFTNAGIPDLAMQNNLETVGNAQVSTSVKKYGTGSLAFDGSGDYLVAPNNQAYAFNTGDFTMECWYYSGATGQQSVLDTRTTGNGAGVLVYTLSNKLRVYSNGSDYGGSISISNNTWTHLVVERISGALYTYVDGTRDINGTSYTPNLTENSFVVGYDSKYGGFGFNGYLDDIRITKGLGRYSGATFTPPAQSLPTY